MDRLRVWAVPVALVVLVVVVSVWANLVDDTTAAVLRALAGGTAVGAMLWGARHHGATPKVAWLLIAGGVGVWVAADALWDALTIGEMDAESGWFALANVMYLTMYPALFAAVVVLAGPLARNGHIDSIIDCAILSLTGMLLLPLFIVDPTSTGNATQDVINAAYPFMDALLLGGIAWLLFSSGTRHPSVWLLIGGIVVLLGVDIAWNLQLRFPDAITDLWINPAYPLAYAVIAAAALHPDVGRLAGRLRRPRRFPAWVQLLFLCVSLTVAAGAALLGDRHDGLVRVIVVGVVAVVEIRFAMLVRQIVHAQRRARYDSLHDGLTGLPNRALLADRLEQALRAGERDGTAVGLLLIDLDRFKEVNDTFGHQHGDGLLAQIGPRLSAVLRDVDTIARLGGDEFAVVLPGVTDTVAAVGVAGKLRAALEEPFLVDGTALGIEASVGVVVSGVHGSDPTTLLQRADIAMYMAKEQKLGAFVYDPQVDGHSPIKLAMLGELRVALEEEQLVLYYQPQVAIDSGQVVCAEALVRWQHPVRGLLYPDDFIPLAEQTGLIGPLTNYVLNAAISQAKVWMDAGRPLTVSVNISARNLLDERLPQQVADLLATHDLPARLLQLEVTESALMADPAKAQRLLAAMAGLGVRLSIDDFGAGYTSLGQLTNLPVSELKIDKSFVMKMAQGPDDALIVQSIVDLGHNLGMTIVAEGVETADILHKLDALTCDIAQGYYHSKAVPAADFDTWRQARKPYVAVPSVTSVRDEPAPVG